jgi:hypothetical protein
VPSVFPSNQPGTTELYRRPMSSSSSMFSVPDSSEFSRLMRSTCFIDPNGCTFSQFFKMSEYPESSIIGSYPFVFDRRSCHRNKNLGETLDELVEGRCRISAIPTISVVWRNEKWVTTDNRRLWVFRHLEQLGKCTTIRVNKTNSIDPRKLDSLMD